MWFVQFMVQIQSLMHYRNVLRCTHNLFCQKRCDRKKKKKPNTTDTYGTYNKETSFWKQTQRVHGVAASKSLWHSHFCLMLMASQRKSLQNWVHAFTKTHVWVVSCSLCRITEAFCNSPPNTDHCKHPQIPLVNREKTAWGTDFWAFLCLVKSFHIVLWVLHSITKTLEAAYLLKTGGSERV